MKFLVIVLSGILITNCTPIIYGKYFYSKRLKKLNKSSVLSL